LNQSSLIDLQLLGLSATQSTLDAFIEIGSHRVIIPTDAAQVLVDKYFIHNHGTYKRNKMS